MLNSRGAQGVAGWRRARFDRRGRQGPKRRIRVVAGGDFHQTEKSQHSQAQEVGSQSTDLEEGGQNAPPCDRARMTHDRTQERLNAQSGESREVRSSHITLRESTYP